MSRFLFIFLLVALIFLASAQGRKTIGSHRGGGHHGYPSHSGLSGSGSHQYPKSNSGLSGSGSHHETIHKTQTHGSQTGVNSGGGHTYPHSTNGLSGTNTNHHQTGGSHGQSHYHTHYHYSPPQQIHYTPAHGAAPVSFPVYHHPPPTYVYEVRDSGSKFSTLLTGLALYNLGRSTTHQFHDHQYKPDDRTKCFLKIVDGSNIEVTRISCQLVSTFEREESHSIPSPTVQTQQTSAATALPAPQMTIVAPTNVNQNTAIETHNATVATPNTDLGTQNVSVASPVLLDNSSVIPPVNIAVTTTAGNESSSTTVTPMSMTPQVNLTQNVAAAQQNASEVVEATKVKGPPIQVHPHMKCYIEIKSPERYSHKEVQCGLLQQYAVQSLRKSAAGRNLVSWITVLTISMSVFILC